MNVKPYSIDTPLEGFISGMPNEIYHSTPGFISKSGLDLINRSPSHYKYSDDTAQTKSMQLGTAIHVAILEPEVFERDYMLLRDVKDRRSAAYKAAVEVHGPDNVLTASDADLVIGMQESVRSDARAMEWLSKIEHAELSLFTTCPTTGAKVRCRYDAITSDGYIIDLKSTRDASPDEFAKSIYNFRYHVQDALYSDAYQWHTGKEIKGFIFLAVENTLPHSVMVYQLDDISKEIGRSEYKKNLATYMHSAITGDWHGYQRNDSGVDLIALPEWAIMRHEVETDSDLIVL